MLISEATVNILNKMHDIVAEAFDISEASAGSGSAVNNETSADDKLDTIMTSLLNSMLDEFEVEEDEALDFIFYVADELTSSGDMPGFPEEDSSPDAVAAWVGAAGLLGFQGLVLSMAEEIANEEEYDLEEDEDEDCGCDEEHDCGCDDELDEDFDEDDEDSEEDDDEDD